MNRRRFLKQSAGILGSSALFAPSARVVGANDRVRVGLVGCGVRGRYLAKLLAGLSGAQLVALCDVYDSQVDEAASTLAPQAERCRDFRQVLDRKDVDAVLVATPDHWHAIPTVMACQAGKDVYVEKPLAHNVREGRAMVEAARRYNRVVQAGTQHRSAPHYREVQEIVQSGRLGEVRYVRVWNFNNMYPNGIGRPPDSPAPSGLDWDLYLGPAPKVPFNRARFLGTFRWFWDYAGGWITDFGTHRLDTVQQIMGVEAPQSVVATGGRYSLKDAGEMPDLLQVTYEYPGFVLGYETCNLNSHGLGGRTPGMAYYRARTEFDRPHGEAFYGTNGALFCDRIGYEIYPELELGNPGGSPSSRRYRMERKTMVGRDTTDLHLQNFLDCVRSRKPPAADVEIGHRSTTVPHLGNIAYKSGRRLFWDAAKEDFIDAPDASRLLGRPGRKPWDLI
ncbi:MAG: Gfo/Idh/MocA family oxidoreductase [Acidobacteriota bacterium]